MRIKEFCNKHLSKHWLVAIVGVFLTLFASSDSNIYKRYQYDETIKNLEKEIVYYKKEIEVNSKKLENLHQDKESLEQFAREEYMMKKANEELFIIERK